MKSKKKLINILLLLCGTVPSFSQIDSVFGTYRTVPFSPTITLYPNNTFSYKSPIDVGYVPTTMGYLEFAGDTIIFKYIEQIYPEILSVEKDFNPERKNILLKISAPMSVFQHISLYVNKHCRLNSRTYSFESNILEIDSILPTDSLLIHFGYYSRIPITLDLENFNEYHYFINLPATPTMYYLEEGKALFKSGLLYFSMTTEGVPYYNTDIFVKRKDVRKIRDMIWKKRIKELENYRQQK